MTVEFITPDGLHRNPAFSQVVVTQANSRTIYVGGQNSVDSSGKIVGKGDIGQQAKQIFKNLEIALSSAGARIDHVIKWNVFIVQGQSLQPGFEEFQRVWANRPNPPLITVLFVAGLANSDFLMEIDAIAVTPNSIG
jgi:enamine deaminase RidA (YjgF/YER057c/UK114 family)